MRIRSPFELMTHSLRGTIFETFVVSEFTKAFSHRGDTPPLYFWRDQSGHEVDLVIDLGEHLFTIEIKSGETITPSYFKGLEFFCGLGKPAAATGMLVHGGSTAYQRGRFRICPWYL